MSSVGEMAFPEDGRSSEQGFLSKEELDALLWVPQRLEEPSAWFGHVPFAHWIVTVLKPQCIVELGTHTGVSYSAFCHAVARRNLRTYCYAVDTWEGDEHTGRYSEEIYRALFKFNEANYGNFSTLLRCTFENALQRFQDSSIDLLHIDGCHTYKAVSRDFNNWRNKLSDRSVVLFHDTNECKNDFGVWRFWNEIKKQYRSFEFLHCHGLGVLCTGTRLPAPITALCEKGERSLEIRFFQTLGRRWEVESLLTQQRLAYGQKLKESAALHSKKISDLNELIQSEQERQRVVLSRVQQQADMEARRLRSEMAEQSARYEQLTSELMRRADYAAQEVEGLRRELDLIVSSRSWRWAQAARRLGDKAHLEIRGAHSKRPKVVALFAGPKDYLRYLRAHRLLQSSPFFDKNWYAKRYADVRNAEVDPIKHYLLCGAKEGRNPSTKFDTKFYLARNKDVAASGMNPLVHFILYGRSEGRQPKDD